MNSGVDDRQSPPLPSGDFLLRLLQNRPVAAVDHPIQSNGHDLSSPHGYIHGYAQNPNPNSRVQSSSSQPISDTFRNVGLYQRDNYSGTDRFHDLGDGINGLSDVSSITLEGNSQFNRFADNFYNTSNVSVSDRNTSGFRDPGDGINGLSDVSSKTLEGSLQFNRLADTFYGSPNTSRNPRGDTRERNGFEADFRNFPNPSSVGSREILNGDGVKYRNSPNLSSGGSNKRGIGYDANYQNLLNLSSGRSNEAVSGFGNNYRISPNLSRIGEEYDRPNKALNGFEADFRSSPNPSRIGEGYDRPNRALNEFESRFRNSPNPSRIGERYDRSNMTLNGSKSDYRNSPTSSRIGEGYNSALNRLDSDFQKFPNYSRNQGNISRTNIARQDAKQLPPGFSNTGTNRNCGRNLDKEKSSSNGSRNWGIKYEDEIEKDALHSVSGFGIKESLSELHREIGENGENPIKVGGRDTIQGDSDDLDEHVLGSLEEEDGSSDKNQKKKRDKDYRSDTRGQRVLAQWMRKSKRMIQCRKDIDMFNAPLLVIFDSLVPPEEEKMKQKQLLVFLEKLVVKEWPESRLLVYGSCANSFGVKKSDIDICLAMKDVDVNKCEILLKLADILKAENLENVQALTHARVPIVKLMDPVTVISCDICINNVLAVVNSKLLRDYAKIDDRLRQLTFIVKHWAKSRGVNETYHGTLSSYAYVLMCIHYLQQCRPAILPCLQEMEITYNVIVENVECAFFDEVEKLAGFGLRNRQNIGQLVWGFFRYWAYCHDYTHDVVSVRVGSIISKHSKDWTRRVGNDRHLICIEDPFEITHDLGRVVDKFSIKVLREEFERAAQILQFDPNPCVTLFEPYVRS